MSKRRGRDVNVEWVHERGLCHGCGACYAVCPSDAVEMVNRGGTNFPEISESCTSCGLCSKVCSGRAAREVRPNPFYGVLESGQDIYLAYSREEAVRECGASGGFVTQYLLELLEKGIVDGAVVAASEGTLGSIRAVIARTPEQVISAAGSKYYPVSSCAALKEIKQGEKYAFVGKGCDLSSLVLMEKAVPGLRDTVYVKVGLLCDHTPYARASRNLLERHDFDPARAHLVYRAEGWPGQTILWDDKRRVRLDLNESWASDLGKVEHYPYRCALCTDGFAESADIAVGDAWALNPKRQQRRAGTSMVIAYSDKGRAEIARLKESRAIEFCRGGVDLLKSGQAVLLAKHEAAHYRLLVLRLLGGISPFSHLGLGGGLRMFRRFLAVRGRKPRRLIGALRFVIARLWRTKA